MPSPLAEAFGDVAGQFGADLHAAARLTRVPGCRRDQVSWNLAPLAVLAVRSTLFENVDQFPPGPVEFDSAFLMSRIAADWRAQPDLLSCERARA